jgi:gamma-glutamylaminecyclotransferase
VYGTLKRGQPNGCIMTDVKSGPASFIGRGITSEKWPLVIASRYNVPYLLNVPGTGHVRHTIRDDV